MKIATRIAGVLAVILSGAAVAHADETLEQISGMLGMSPVTEQSCAAIWLPVPEGQAVVGVRWYNNDDQTVFPRVLLASGQSDEMVDTSEAVTVATDAQGVAEGWSEVTFDQPYACLSEGLYCVFMLPEGSEYTAIGSGGGAAFGYTVADCGHQGWLGGDDDTWLRIAGAIGLAIDPILVEADDAMVFLKRVRGNESVQAAPILLGAHPNPFNPQVTFEFSLPNAMPADLTIYDVQGHLVRRLVSGHQESGLHSVAWLGDDDRGRGQASGVYLVRFAAGQVQQTQRLVLVK